MKQIEFKMSDFDAYIHQNRNKILLYFLVLLSLILRVSFFFFYSGDFNEHISKWCGFIDNNMHFSVFKDDFYNYSPLYIYLIYIMKVIGADCLYGVKSISVFFDYLTAYYIYKILKLKFTEGNVPKIAFFVSIFAPAMILNSSCWGQCDSIYTSFVVISLYYLFEKKYFFTFLMLGIAFSFKLQALFILPFYIAMYFVNKNFSITYFLIIPVIYVASLLPCVLAGRDFYELLFIYFNQFGTSAGMSFNATSIYNLVPESYRVLGQPSLIFTMSVCTLITYLYVLVDKELNYDQILELIFIVSFIVPFFLPGMHERYFFMADVISVIYAFNNFRKNFYALTIPLVSFFSYTNPLFGAEQIIAFKYLSFINLILFSFMVYLVSCKFRESKNTD